MKESLIDDQLQQILLLSQRLMEKQIGSVLSSHITSRNNRISEITFKAKVQTQIELSDFPDRNDL